MDRDAVAIVVPTYNGSRFVREALGSVFAQTRNASEIVVVDDCSLDGTPELVESIVKTAPVPTRLIRLSRNSGGPARPINIGIDHSSSGLVLVLDQDDVLHPERLARDVPVLLEHPDVSVVFSWCGRNGVDGDETYQWPELKNAVAGAGALRDGFIGIDGLTGLRLLLRHKNFVFGYPGMLFRKTDWTAKGGVDESLRIASDMDLVGWLFRRGNAALVPGIGYYRRMHEDNVTRRRVETNYEISRVCCRFVIEEPALRTDPEAAATVTADIRGLIYWFRQAGYYTEAAKLCSLLRELGESRTRVGVLSLKLKMHAAWRHLVGLPLEESIYTRSTDGLPR